MSCFTPTWIENFLIGLVFVIALVAIINLVVPWALSAFGGPPDGGMILQILRIVIWAVVAVFVILFVFDIAQCVLGNGGLRLRP